MEEFHESDETTAMRERKNKAQEMADTTVVRSSPFYGVQSYILKSIFPLYSGGNESLEGLVTQSMGERLLTFQKKVTKHLKEHGMDTITHLVSLNDITKVVSVVKHHALFQPETGAKEGNDQKKSDRCDSCCHDCDDDA